MQAQGLSQWSLQVLVCAVYRVAKKKPLTLLGIDISTGPHNIKVLFES